ncbi:trp operon leader peptide [Salmonella enterica]|uniref:trp operon leader peptide n=2 Tax=Salmonella enterica TaxID=28901 RepID=A0A626SNL8_SALER|nr:trp operon leader peptide [Salmonella enterica]EAN3266807.1 trp operon leader peptide [Salmonella enterica subsp. enterica serovar Oranienburg]EAS5050224.1 trp operon leader peptide [Salmonella enterica subsp. enterica serovar Poona]EAY2110351.1 trp operon leader peptide [Salmonella enterica subsp. enterica serovar Typhimurium]EBC9075455.1 trp operon leader peptide [Salmonella enterica subsp. enterica serovar Schwarzengrund]EBF9826130.1 trp operon leader peptide [Salmonella enterica subsp. 
MAATFALHGWWCTS